jgi:hypothetical protein
MAAPNDNETATVLDPQGVPRTIPGDKLNDALASGGKQATKVIDPQGTARWVPNEHIEEAKAAGGTVVNPDGSFVVTPKEGESFADTMRRAANAGKSVTPEVIQSQTKKGIKDAPLALAAGPAIATGQLAGETGLAALGAATPEAISAVKAMAEAHPVAAQLIKRALEGAAFAGGGAGVVKHTKWLWNILP